jgi:sigma-54 specific flagellar transcriptional regulator A
MVVEFFMNYKHVILSIVGDKSIEVDLDRLVSPRFAELIVASKDNWEEVALSKRAEDSLGEISLAIISEDCPKELNKLLSAISLFDDAIPFITINTNVAHLEIRPEHTKRFVASLSPEAGYDFFNESVQKAFLLYDRFSRLRNFQGERNFKLFRELVGESRRLQEVRHMMEHVADKEVSVLITGESGTGKEVVARNLHLNSSRRDSPFVPINCGAIPSDLLESELFGHEKGAFTGAVSARIGRFELASGGTLFLDEIGDMPLNMQVKLLRVLQERSFERVGGTNTINVNVRILAATHKNLEKMIAANEFRQDLYYRLNVFPIEMPALRERSDDVPLLMDELVTQLEESGRGSVRFNSGAINALTKYDWPGNVRELANLIERMSILFPHGIVGIGDLPKHFVSNFEGKKSGAEVIKRELNLPENSLLPLSGLNLKEYLANLERDLIVQALRDSQGVVSQAAQRLDLGRTTLVEKMKKFSLPKDD